MTPKKKRKIEWRKASAIKRNVFVVLIILEKDIKLIYLTAQDTFEHECPSLLLCSRLKGTKMCLSEVKMNNSHLNYLNQITSDIRVFHTTKLVMFLPEFVVMVTYVKNLICSAAGYIPDKRTTGMNFPWKTASPILEKSLWHECADSRRV